MGTATEVPAAKGRAQFTARRASAAKDRAPSAGGRAPWIRGRGSGVVGRGRRGERHCRWRERDGVAI